MKKILLTLLKFALPLAIIVWLVMNIPEEDFRELTERSANWGTLVLALVICFSAVCITFVRWWLLVRALGLPFRLRDAFRLGFLGFLFNFVSIGAVGGDLFKAYFIAREQPGRRTEAVATVVVDRMIGLYALLIVTSAAILFSGGASATPEVVVISRATFIATGIGGIAVLMVLVPGFTSGSVSEFLSGLPRVGPTFQRLIAAVRMYRSRPGVLAIIGVMSLLVHCLMSFAMFLAAGAMFAKIPTLAEHLIIVPLSLVAGALPLAPNGLGTFELAMSVFYDRVPADQAIQVSGTLIAFTFRVITIVIAMIGVVYYWTSRREMRELMDKAQREDAASQKTQASAEKRDEA